MRVAVFIVAVVTAALIGALSPLAQKIGLVDQPNSRKAHLGDVPLVGGLGIFAAYLIGAFLLVPELQPVAVFAVASAVIVLGGLLDDFFELRPIAKIAFQVSAILLMCVAGGVSVQTIGSLVPEFGPVELGFLAIPFTLVAAIGVINAVNLSDGLDGLAGFQLLVAFGALAILAQRAGQDVHVGQLLLLMSCLVGFLVFNARVFGRKKASVFLGDAGTMFLGFTYVWLAIDLSTGPEAVMSPITALWLLAVPICDTVTMMIRRLARGRSPFRADKEHLHHVLMMAGFTVGETVMILTGMAVAAAAIGIAGEVFAMPNWAMLVLFVSAAMLYLSVILRSWTVMRFLRWSICRRRAVADRRTNMEQRKQQRPLPAGVSDRRSGSERRRGERRTRKVDVAPQPAGVVVTRLSQREGQAGLSLEQSRSDSPPATKLAGDARLQAGRHGG